MDCAQLHRRHCLQLHRLVAAAVGRVWARTRRHSGTPRAGNVCGAPGLRPAAGGPTPSRHARARAHSTVLATLLAEGQIKQPARKALVAKSACDRPSSNIWLVCAAEQQGGAAAEAERQASGARAAIRPGEFSLKTCLLICLSPPGVQEWVDSEFRVGEIHCLSLHFRCHSVTD